MPIYEYACDACGHRFEKLQKMSDEPLTDCPDCAESALKKLVSAAAFRLKGSGWYETDFKNNTGKKAAETKSDAASSNTTAKKAETKADKTTTNKT